MRPLRKVFLQTQFGTPHAWTEQYLENFKRLAPDGWYLKVFTPNVYDVQLPNIEIIPMTIADFDRLMAYRCGIEPAGNRIENGKPVKLVSDYYPAYGHIFQEWIRHFDYWAFTNWDMVYGRLSDFLPDEEIAKYDIWSDDRARHGGLIAGLFTLMRNDERINNLFRQIRGWQHSFTVHEPCAFDELQFTRLVRQLDTEGSIRFGYPPKRPYHRYDRQPQHRPTPNLCWDDEGTLIELYQDPALGERRWNSEFEPRSHGQPIMMFHFCRTKTWPEIAS